MKYKTLWKWGAGILTVLMIGILMSMTVIASIKLDAPEEAYWDGNHVGMARWKKVRDAHEYQVKLYESGDRFIKTVTVSGTRVDLREYMTEGGYYHFCVRAMPKSHQNKYTSSDWTEAEGDQMTGLGVTDGRWRTYSQGKKYQRDDKTYITDQWELIGSEWYYFGQEGYALIGWQQIGDNWYYLNEDGIMQTGWLNYGENWYYLDADGSRVVGWKQVKPGEWYYLDADGKMLSNMMVDGYQLDSSGKWIQ